MEYYSSIWLPTDCLAHHGIKGMRWGVRRWQNSDGSFNEAGKRRYFSNGSGEDYKKIGSVGGAARRALAKVYDVNERFYSKHGNKTMASMNKAAKDEQLRKASQADKLREDKLKAKTDRKNEKNKLREEKFNEEGRKADKALKNARNSEEAEKALASKIEHDIRAGQSRLQRVLKYFDNIEVASFAAHEVVTKMNNDKIKAMRSSMTTGQKAVDFFLGGSQNMVLNDYMSKGYKNLGSEYKKADKEQLIANAKRSRDAHHRELAREREKRYQEIDRKRELEYQREHERMFGKG